MISLVVKNAKVVTESGIYYGGFAVEDGKIALMASDSCLPDAEEIVDAQGKYVIPGGIDSHVHIRAPGIDYRETFLTGSSAAASSGTTVLIEMPLTKPATYSVEELQKRIDAAEAQSIVDIAFHGAAGTLLENIEPLADAGVTGFKTFIQAPPKGREDEYTGVTVLDEYELYQAFRAVEKTGLPLGVHTENFKLVNGVIAEFKRTGRTKAEDHAPSRPVLAEIEMVEKLIRYGKEFSNPLYLTHLTNSVSADLAMEAKRAGQKIIAETCPHYLYMTDEDIARKGPIAVCNPPLRSKETQDKLWESVKTGQLDIISSDHAPYPLAEKEPGLTNIFNTMPGMPGLEMRVPLMLTAVSQEKLSIMEAVNLISTNPAKVFGLYPRKGTLKVGSDADFVIADLDCTYAMDHNNMFTLCRESGKVYDGMQMKAKVITTAVRGKVVFDRGAIKAEAGHGRFLKSNRALGLD